MIFHSFTHISFHTDISTTLCKTIAFILLWFDGSCFKQCLTFFGKAKSEHFVSLNTGWLPKCRHFRMCHSSQHRGRNIRQIFAKWCGDVSERSGVKSIENLLAVQLIEFKRPSQLGDVQDVKLLSVREMNGRLCQCIPYFGRSLGIASAAAAAMAASVPRGQRVSIGAGRSSLAKELSSRVIIPHKDRWFFELDHLVEDIRTSLLDASI